VTAADAAFDGLCLQAGAITVSGVIAVLVIIWNVRIARRRATLDILINEQTHSTTITERTDFLKIKATRDVLQWTTDDKAGSPQLETIRAILNRYELVAAGIKCKALDAKLYKHWTRTTLVEDWIAFKPLVVHVRAKNGNPKLFCEFEAVAKKWAKNSERELI